MASTDEAADPAWEAYQQDAAAAAASLTAVAGGGAPFEASAVDGAGGDTSNSKPPAPSKRKPGRPRKHPPAAAAPRKNHEDRWREHIEGLRAFKAVHGHVNVSRVQDARLGKFVNSQREYYRKLIEGKPSSLTPERIDDLEELGFVWIVRQKEFAKNLAKLSEGDKPTTSTLKVLAKAASEKKEEKRLSKDDLSWSGYLEKLRAFKAQSGHLRVPFADNRPRKNPHPRAAADDETIQLGKWVKRQRRAHSQGKLSQERVEALEEIGFSFKPGNATKEEKIEIQLGLLDNLRKRRELTNAQVADLDYLYEEWKARANERAPKPVHAKAGGKFSAKWQMSYDQLKEFQAQNGHTRVPQAQKQLGKWVDYQRQCYWKKQKGEKVALTDERIHQLEAIGFEWRIRHVLPMKSSLPGTPGVASLKSGEGNEGDDVDLSSVFAASKEVEAGDSEQTWNRHFDELSRYQQAVGTTLVTKGGHSEYAQEVAALANWCDRQRAAYKKLKAGDRGGLNRSRVKRLQQIGFVFEMDGRPMDFRGWDGKLEMLKAFQKENGHCRVPLRKKKKDDRPADEDLRKLAKWVEHQRALYWKRAKGEKNSLSDERIAALDALDFEWRVIKDHRFSSSGYERLDPPGSGTKTAGLSADQLVDYAGIPSLPAPDVDMEV
ncbi:hypothetical protein ACHAXT_007335 [Thalassiosira profunda]